MSLPVATAVSVAMSLSPLVKSQVSAGIFPHRHSTRSILSQHPCEELSSM